MDLFLSCSVFFILLLSTESGFSSFLAMPVKDGWRHVGTDDYKNAPPSNAKPPGDQSSQLHTYGNVGKMAPQPAIRMPDRPYANSLSDLDQRKPGYEGTPEAPGSLKTFRSFTPKRPVRTVHFDQDSTKGYGSLNCNNNTNTTTSITNNNNNSNGNYQPNAKQTVHAPGTAASKSREPRFQPQFQSSRLRSNPSYPQGPAGDVVSNGTQGGNCVGLGGGNWGGSSGLGSDGYHHQNSPGADPTRHHGDLAFYGTGRRDVGVDSLNDSADTGDEGNTTTTSGSYAVDQDEVIQELQSDIFV